MRVRRDDDMSRSRATARDPEDQGSAREAALALLERMRRTRLDLRRRLREKGFAVSAVDAVIERLAEVGLVDDVEYARAWLSGRWGRRMAGWRRLEADLRRKGIVPGDIASARAALEREQGGADELSGARRAIAQAERRLVGLDPRVRRQRLYALLARRGFDPDTIERALRPAKDLD
jgi:regulatory protein